MQTALLLGILVGMGAAVQEPKLRWMEFYPPVYPQMARIANIEGTATVEITIGPDGAMVLQKAAGHPILVQAAEVSLKLSKLVCDYCAQRATQFTIVFDFRIPSPECGNSGLNSSPRAVLDASTHITITTDRHCFSDPAPELGKRVRSLRCLYLWKCATRRY
ncbi:MAG: energy transducer TonB [Candidatus Angelobacter sp.]